ncbi:MAG: HEAT repeat domain-containing protein [Planctomycetes bacterium]|nr:HEAT repeat domain-containing protein [Planctomycetota bacterium]
MSRKRKIIWLTALLVLPGGIGGYYWYWQSHAIDRKVCDLVYEAAGYPDTPFEKKLRRMKLDFLLREKPKPRECIFVEKEVLAMGNAATPALVSLLNDENPGVRCDAADFLGGINDTRAVEPLIQTLQKDQDSYVRDWASSSLGKLGDKRAVEVLIKTLQNDQDESVRRDSAESLGKLGDKRAVDPLIQALEKDKCKLVRVFSAYALGKLGDSRAISALEDVIQRKIDIEFQPWHKQSIEWIKAAATRPVGAATSTASGQN